MANLRNKKLFNKSYNGLSIDWGSPITKKLWGAWLFNEGSGVKFRDLANNTTFTIDGDSSKFTWGNGKNGKAIKFDVTFNGGNLVANRSIYGDMTALAIITRDEDTTKHSGHDDLHTFLSTAPTNTNGFNAYIGNNFASAGSKNKVQVETKNGGTPNTLFINGIKQASAVVSDNELTTKVFYVVLFSILNVTAGGNNLLIGHGVLAGEYFFKGRIQTLYLWNRILSDNESSYISRNPYAFINYPRKRTFIPAIASPGGISSVRLERRQPRGELRGILRGVI